MTRKKLIEMMPVINAIIEGKKVQIYDSFNLSLGRRGWWKTTDDWGLLAPLEYYRIKNEDGTIHYFGEDIFEDYDFDHWEKYSKNHC